MKKLLIILSLGLSFLFSQNSIAQVNKEISDIKAKVAWWQTTNSKLSISDALKGVVVSEELTIIIELQPQTLVQTGNSIQKFEIKWYRYGSRGLYLTDSFAQTINLTEQAKNKEAITIKSTRKNVQSGWWIVEVLAYYDNGFVTLDGKTQYRIKVL